MRNQGVGIRFSGMAGEAKNRRLALKQGLTWSRMTAMAREAFPFFHRLVDTTHGVFCLPLIMTIKADLGRFLT
jgi:hypothetical protein